MNYEPLSSPMSAEESLLSLEAPQEKSTILISWALQWTLASRSPEGLEPAIALLQRDFGEDLEQFQVPWIQYAEHRGRLARPEVDQWLGRRRYPPDTALRHIDPFEQEGDPQAVAARFLEFRTLPAAATVAMQSARDPDPLVRIAGALASLVLLRFDRSRNLRIIRDATQDRDPHIRELALFALSVVDPAAVQLVEQAGTPPDPDELHTSLLIHGTFARSLTWWHPGQTFHSYLLAGVASDFYNGPQPPSWNGGYTNEARALGALELMSWGSTHSSLQMNKVLCHSHGGSVAMLASQSGMEIDQLVLLSCPAREGKYLPDFQRVADTIAFRVRLDRILLLDMIRYPDTRARFSHPSIREHTLPLWFDHTATRQPNTWEDHDLASKL